MGSNPERAEFLIIRIVVTPYFSYYCYSPSSAYFFLCVVHHCVWIGASEKKNLKIATHCMTLWRITEFDHSRELPQVAEHQRRVLRSKMLAVLIILIIGSLHDWFDSTWSFYSFQLIWKCCWNNQFGNFQQQRLLAIYLLKALLNFRPPLGMIQKWQIFIFNIQKLF